VAVPPNVRREFQLASIDDVQGTIHANDSKSSAALVVHGLLFAGVLAITASAVNLYDRAAVWARVIAVALLVVALVCFTVSVYCLLRSVNPFDPQREIDRLGGRVEPDIFFLRDQYVFGRAEGPLEFLRNRTANLTQEQIETLLAHESLKLMRVRDEEARWARRGVSFLIGEVVAVALFLVLVGLVAAGAGFARRSDPATPPGLAVQVREASGVVESRSTYGTIALPPGARVAELRAVGSGSRLGSVRLSETARYRCRGNRRAPVIVRSASETGTTDSAPGRLTLAHAPAPIDCPSGARRVSYLVDAEATTRSGADARETVAVVERP
jgi:hypothetical protein